MPRTADLIVKAKKKKILTLKKLVRTNFTLCPQGAVAKHSADRNDPGSGVAALCALELRETGRAVPRPAAAHGRELFQKWSQSLPGL